MYSIFSKEVKRYLNITRELINLNWVIKCSCRKQNWGNFQASFYTPEKKEKTCKNKKITVSPKEHLASSKEVKIVWRNSVTQAVVCDHYSCKTQKMLIMTCWCSGYWS